MVFYQWSPVPFCCNIFANSHIRTVGSKRQQQTNWTFNKRTPPSGPPWSFPLLRRPRVINIKMLMLMSNTHARVLTELQQQRSSFFSEQINERENYLAQSAKRKREREKRRAIEKGACMQIRRRLFTIMHGSVSIKVEWQSFKQQQQQLQKQQ